MSIGNEKVKFKVRAIRIAIHNNQVLFQKPEQDKFWALPGGKCELMECTKDTLIREMEEELGEKIEVGRLQWVIENFFTINNKECHEIGLYYLMNFQSDSDLYKNEIIRGKEKEKKLTFKWFNINELQNEIIKPEFLVEKLKNISSNIEHIIIKDN